jgi:hypothetical protein
MNYLDTQPDNILRVIVSFLVFRPDTNALQVASKSIRSLVDVYECSGHKEPHGIHISERREAWMFFTHRFAITYRDGVKHGMEYEYKGQYLRKETYHRNGYIEWEIIHGLDQRSLAVQHYDPSPQVRSSSWQRWKTYTDRELPVRVTLEDDKTGFSMHTYGDCSASISSRDEDEYAIFDGKQRITYWSRVVRLRRSKRRITHEPDLTETHVKDTYGYDEDDRMIINPPSFVDEKKKKQVFVGTRKRRKIPTFQSLTEKAGYGFDPRSQHITINDDDASAE